MKRLVELILIGLLVTVCAVNAQNNPPTDPKKSGPKSQEVRGSNPPERINAEIEEFARKRQLTNPNPAARAPFFSISYAANANEFAALRRYSVMLHTAISQKSEELLLKRIFIRANGQETQLQKVSSWRSEVAPASLTYKVYGPYREQGFYLIPTGMMVRDGQMLVDFA